MYVLQLFKNIVIRDIQRYIAIEKNFQKVVKFHIKQCVVLSSLKTKRKKQRATFFFLFFFVKHTIFECAFKIVQNKLYNFCAAYKYVVILKKREKKRKK
jgi:hypothetical protein